MGTSSGQDFEVLSTELLHDTPIIALRRDQVRMPGGKVAAREIVEHFGAVAVVAFDEARGEIAVVNQYRPCVGRRLIELPAGILDVAGEDPLTAAKRELYEEAGLAASSWVSLVDVVTSPGFCDEAVRVFLARGLSATERPAGEDEEADMTLDWMPLAQARAAALAGQVVNSIAVAGIFAASEVLERGAQPRSADAEFELRPQALAARRQREGVAPDMKKL
ncbi:ADP-ribose pyrophosphatase [Corynebacterium atypicum]|uniref:ADP-ribose pyrophosphatase n=1 Tax=Corynebacterium atypicum TaxID=191610 RepID=A0ABN4DGD0_9CORY|nr:NUDIX hydrolase [Corynebacterium atypicum]AIG64182.1 ADP-ribose pyrophosphatase [Corynebacterium atypicum]